MRGKQAAKRAACRSSPQGLLVRTQAQEALACRFCVRSLGYFFGKHTKAPLPVSLSKPSFSESSNSIIFLKDNIERRELMLPRILDLDQ